MGKRIGLKDLKSRHAVDRRMIRDCIRNYLMPLPRWVVTTNATAPPPPEAQVQSPSNQLTKLLTS